MRFALAAATAALAEVGRIDSRSTPIFGGACPAAPICALLAGRGIVEGAAALPSRAAAVNVAGRGIEDGAADADGVRGRGIVDCADFSGRLASPGLGMSLKVAPGRGISRTSSALLAGAISGASGTNT
jgi:hypothetical protein